MEVLNPIASKKSKDEVNYKVGAKCANCVNFINPQHCKMVDGFIAPEGLCDLFSTEENSKPYSKDFFMKEYQSATGKSV